MKSCCNWWVFQSKTLEMGKIVIHGIHVSRKCQEVKSHSWSIHRIFVHNTSLLVYFDPNLRGNFRIGRHVFKTKNVWCTNYFGEDCTLKIAAWLLSFCSCNCKEEQQVTFWIQAEENVSRLIESTCLRNTTKENVIWITSYPVHMNTKNTTSILTVR